MDFMHKCSAVAEMGDRLATIDMSQKLGAVLLLGGAGSSVPSGIFIHPAVWPQQTWAENGDECAPFFVEGSWVPI